MGLLLRGLIKFWRPIATGVGSILAWESIDEAVAPEDSKKEIGGLLMLVTVSGLLIIALFSGALKINSKKR